MGIQDLDKLIEIKKWIRQFEIIHNVDFDFIVDVDTQEGRTRILIDETGHTIRAKQLSQQEANSYKSKGYVMLVPDLMDWKRKLVIEYQEEPKKGRGAHYGKKGHTEFSDENKDLYYQLGGLKQLKLWEETPRDQQQKELNSFLFKYI